MVDQPSEVERVAGESIIRFGGGNRIPERQVPRP